MSKSLRKRLSRSSLGFRLGSTLALALLPLGLLAIVQAEDARRDIEDSTLAGAAGASLRAVQAQIDLIRDAQTTARAFAASLAHSLNEGAPCTGRAKSVAATIPEASLVAYIPLSGLMTCSSNDAVFDFGDNPLFQQMIAEPVGSVVYNPFGPVTGAAIVGIGHPVFAPDGSQIGIVAISLPYAALTPDDFRDEVAGWRPEFLATVTPDGRVLIASDTDRDLEAALPGTFDLANLPDRAGGATFETDARGRRILAVTPVATDLFLVSVWQNTETGLRGALTAAAPFLLPGLTWIAAFAVAGFASSRLVVRHVRSLSRSMADYLQSRSRMIVPNITDAPAEIQRLHAAYEELARTIEQEEAELQNLIVDKDRLLREVNHRVGNSLQIIASVMRMYRREAQEPAVHEVLDGMINRVIALSSTHNSLYDLAGQSDVPLDDVVFGVIRRLKEIHRIPGGTTERRLQPIRTDAETAVGVAMAAAEAVGAFFARPGLATGQIEVALEQKDERILLEISAPIVPEFEPGAEKGARSLPRRMLHQLASQLDGTLKIDAGADRATVTLELPVKPGKKG